MRSVMNKDNLKANAQKWGKRAAFFAVLGVTGVAAVLAINTYRAMKGLDEIDWDNLKL